MTYSVCSQQNKVSKFTYLGLRGAQVLSFSGLMNEDITAIVCSAASRKRKKKAHGYELMSGKTVVRELCGLLALGFTCCSGTLF